MLPDFNRLRIFYSIYARESIAIASKELHLTQSAVSQQLKKLEEELKVRLFTRMHKKIVPTSAGHDLHERMEPFIKSLTEGVSKIRNEKNGPYGKIKIGSPVVFGNTKLIQFISKFLVKYPEVNFELILDHPTILMDKLLSGKVDFSFSDIYSSKEDFEKNFSLLSSKILFNENLILACSKKYQQKHLDQSELNFETLAKQSYISYHPHYPALKNWFRSQYKKSPTDLKIMISVESVQAQLTALKSGLGICLIPEHVVAKELKNGNVIKLEAKKYKEMVNSLSIVQLLDKTPSFKEKIFIDEFMEYLNEHKS